jgi:hypothetical protein
MPMIDTKYELLQKIEKFRRIEQKNQHIEKGSLCSEEI